MSENLTRMERNNDGLKTDRIAGGKQPKVIFLGNSRPEEDPLTLYPSE